MLLLGEQDFAATGHDSFDANAIVMVTLRQATRLSLMRCMRAWTLDSGAGLRFVFIPHLCCHSFGIHILLFSTCCVLDFVLANEITNSTARIASGNAEIVSGGVMRRCK